MLIFTALLLVFVGSLCSSGHYPCGGLLTYSRGSFHSPNYPGNYHNNEHCVWNIRTPSRSRINLTFTDIQTECYYDEVEIYDGDQNSRSLGRYCNGAPLTFVSSSNALTVNFSSDASVIGKGFNADYSTLYEPHETSRLPTTGFTTYRPTTELTTPVPTTERTTRLPTTELTTPVPTTERTTRLPTTGKHLLVNFRNGFTSVHIFTLSSVN
uniref:Uncharacterized protein n=1 Tax=Sphaerodactylus townsendi TaxID=933632 RepID=A0ACB8F9Z5_9SAUR